MSEILNSQFQRKYESYSNISYFRGTFHPLTLKIPGPHFPPNYRVNANWHEGFNGIFSSLFAFLRVPVDVYGWYRSDLSPTCHQSDLTYHPGPWNAGGKLGLKCCPVLAWQIHANWQDAVF